jgi:hypothetical protein
MYYSSLESVKALTMRDMMLTTSALKATAAVTLLLEVPLVCLLPQLGLSLALVTLTLQRAAVAVVDSKHRYKMRACSLTA